MCTVHKGTCTYSLTPTDKSHTTPGQAQQWQTKKATIVKPINKYWYIMYHFDKDCNSVTITIVIVHHMVKKCITVTLI